jgi:uncharacterized protein YkwD
LDEDTVTRGAVAVVVRRGMEYESGLTAPFPTTDTPIVIVTPTNTTETPTESAVPTMTIDEMKAEIVRLTNEEREKAGLNPVEVLPELMDCAQAKARDFIDNHYFSHVSPQYGTAPEMIFARISNAGTAAENIAGWSKTPTEAMQVWMESQTGHRETILTERLTHIGVGIIEVGGNSYLWVQQFVKLYP